MLDGERRGIGGDGVDQDAGRCGEGVSYAEITLRLIG